MIDKMFTDHSGHDIGRDEFAKLPGVTRHMPGDCHCFTCRAPIPFNWNNGHPIPVTESDQ